MSECEGRLGTEAKENLFEYVESNFIKLLSHLTGSLGNKLEGGDGGAAQRTEASAGNLTHSKAQLYRSRAIPITNYQTITQTATVIIKSVLYST